MTVFVTGACPIIAVFGRSVRSNLLIYLKTLIPVFGRLPENATNEINDLPRSVTVGVTGLAQSMCGLAQRLHPQVRVAASLRQIVVPHQVSYNAKRDIGVSNEPAGVRMP